MKVASIMPESISKFKVLNQPDYNKMVQMPAMEVHLKDNEFHVKRFDFLALEDNTVKDMINNFIEYAADYWVICAHFCLKDLRNFIEKLSEKVKAMPKIICYGTGVLDWQTALKTIPSISAVVPMNSVGAVTDWLVADRDNVPLEEVSGIAFRSGKNNYIFQKREKDDFSEIIRKTPIEENISTYDRKMAYLWGSNGCWYGQCTFCNIGAMQKNYSVGSWFPRPVEDIVEDMKQLYKLGVKQILFLDAEFIGRGEAGRKRACCFAENVIEAGLNIEYKFSCRADSVDEETFKLLKRSGLNRVFLGIESGCQAAIERYHKGVNLNKINDTIDILRKLGIDFKADFMIANTESSMCEIRESLLYIKRKKLLNVMNTYGVGSIFHKLHLHAGTPLFDEIADEKERYLGIELECRFKDETVEQFYKDAMKMDEWMKEELEKTIYVVSDKKKYFGYSSYMKIIGCNILLNIVEEFERHEKPYNREEIFQKYFDQLKGYAFEYKKMMLNLETQAGNA